MRKKIGSDYSRDAYREAVINSIVHREYALERKIAIKIYPDHMIIDSPGGLFAGLTKDDILTGTFSHRNKMLSTVFKQLNLVEEFGTGINKIIQSYKDSDANPDFNISINSFKLILPNKNFEPLFQSRSVSFTAEGQVFNYIRQYGSIDDIQAGILLGISNDLAGNLLIHMTHFNALIRVNNNNGDFYIIGK
ncbi:MAG: hypothetical protein LBR80_09950 [Deltaproteobacteria bacterium]|nr:hypothetical protein [Deltaproteobacteria bacterium]